MLAHAHEEYLGAINQAPGKAVLDLTGRYRRDDLGFDRDSIVVARRKGRVEDATEDALA